MGKAARYLGLWIGEQGDLVATMHEATNQHVYGSFTIQEPESPGPLRWQHAMKADFAAVFHPGTYSRRRPSFQHKQRCLKPSRHAAQSQLKLPAQAAC